MLAAAAFRQLRLQRQQTDGLQSKRAAVRRIGSTDRTVLVVQRLRTTDNLTFLKRRLILRRGDYCAV